MIINLCVPMFMAIMLCVCLFFVQLGVWHNAVPVVVRFLTV